MEKDTMVDKLYSKFKQLKMEATADCKFDRAQIENSFDNTTKLMKWINKKSEWNKVYRIFENDRKEKYRKIYEFYATDFPMKLNSKEEYSVFIESDPGYIDVLTHTQVTKEIIVYIDSVIDLLKSRAWEIKACIEYLKFSNGN